MFERLKNAFIQGSNKVTDVIEMVSVSEWAGTQGFSCTELAEGKGFSLKGAVGGKPWQMDCGRSSRDYIHGEELRARAELKIKDDVSVLIMNRPLKEALEKRAYEMYTDTLHTADPSLPEEMRWLAMYPEVGWDKLSKSFWGRYSVMAEQSSQAVDWLDQHLANLLLSWPQPGPDQQVPFMLMLLRGKAYLRMQYSFANIPTLAHAVNIFTYASQSAINGLSTDIAL